MRDTATIGLANERLEKERDVIERLLLRAQIAQAETVDISARENNFVTWARTYSEATGIGVRAFQAEGVPDDVLRRAGLLRGRAGGTRRRTSGTRVTRDDVRSALPSGAFTIQGLADATGSSIGTVRALVTELLAAGELRDLGPDKAHRGPGRAPARYERKGSDG